MLKSSSALARASACRSTCKAAVWRRSDPWLRQARRSTYALDGGRLTLEFGPADFIQINREVNIAMVAAAIELLQPGPGDGVLDLFCGLGNFTLPLSRRCRHVAGVEADAALIARARANAVRNGITNAEFFADNLFEPAGFGRWAERGYDRVLLDPPRAGAVAIMERVAHWRPRRVVYISCHPGSLARDAGILVHCPRVPADRRGGHGYVSAYDAR